MDKIVVQTEDFDVSQELALMRAKRKDIGAIASFVGYVRDMNDGQQVTTLTLEHYPQMTEKSLQDIVSTAQSRWSMLAATVIHRVGTLQLTDQIVLVAVASAHRKEAFEACAFIMDYLKTDAPFWKKENMPTGARWVDAKGSDDQAKARWATPNRSD